MRQVMLFETALVGRCSRRQWKINWQWALTRHVPSTNSVVIVTAQRQTTISFVFLWKRELIMWQIKTRNSKMLNNWHANYCSDINIYIYILLKKNIYIYTLTYCQKYYNQQYRPMTSAWEIILKQKSFSPWKFRHLLLSRQNLFPVPKNTGFDISDPPQKKHSNNTWER